MSVVLNEVRRATYFDSIVLMRISRQITGLPGVEEAGLILGTPANKDILRDAGILGPEGDGAEPGDLILALRAKDAAAGAAALAEAKRLLEAPREAATHAGMNVMIFSDNVPIADEAAIKHEARDRGLFVMGPDCGTAIIGGVPLAFANVVPRGEIGIIGASGTGIQEVSCLIARAGHGVSHAIGTGGRDLKAEVGAITTLMAIDALDADARTKHIVLISKPPETSVAKL